ncbi:MAG: glutathione S-transferase C-terminal domain-containing protein [SAR324 cluster bacterium]|nr:glutathione S-transferase C-terminal domain-containing protein [SAR324 cluster bacterium]
MDGSCGCGTAQHQNPNSFSLADIAWIPNVRRLDIMLYPLNRHPHLLAWYKRVKERASYYKGVTGTEHPPALAHFKAYSIQRAAEGTGITAFKPLAGIP